MSDIILTMVPGRSIETLRIDDVLEIDWHGAMEMMHDAIIRVQREGDLASQTIRDALCLSALSFKKLESDANEQRRLLAHAPRFGFWDWLLMWTPSNAGARRRKSFASCREVARKRVELASIRKKFVDLRLKLADAIDERVDAVLRVENAEYRGLTSRLASIDSERRVVETMLNDLAGLRTIERKAERRRRIRVIIGYCKPRHAGQMRNRVDAEVYLRGRKIDLDMMAADSEKSIAFIRDERKRSLYQSADST